MNDKDLFKPIKICRVCGDVAIGFNFNGLSCESCKAFFRRNVLKEKDFECKNENNCLVDRTTRKFCKRCRMDKCLAIGMKKNLIFSRNKHEFEKDENQPKIIRIYKNTTDLKCHELVRLIEVRDAVTVFQEADNFTQIVESQNVLEMANVQEEFAKIAIKFCKKLSAFKNLSQPDQLILFKNFFPERCILRSAFQYDHKKDGFPVLQSDGKAIFVPLSIVKYIPQYPNAYAVLRKMCLSLNLAMENDFTIRDLISSLLLFKDRTNVSNRENIRYHYILYNYLLKRYLEHKYSNVEKANEKYHTFISLLRLLEMATEHMKCFYTNMQQQTQNPDQIAQILREIYYDS